MHPVLEKIDTLLKEQKKTRDTFACEFLDHLGLASRYIQGKGEKHRCNKAWKSQIYRMFETNITPRPERLEALEKWYEQNK